MRRDCFLILDSYDCCLFGMGDRMMLSLEEIQSEELKLLTWFDSFCTEHGLRYSLDGGSLLGAVRHHGFIPWDDDVDLMMPRPDYEILLGLCNALPQYYEMRCSRLRNGCYPFIKICNKQIRAQEASLAGLEEEYLWIDVFPADGVPEGDAELHNHFLHINRLNVRAARIGHRSIGFKEIIKKIYRLLLGNRDTVIDLYNEVDAAAQLYPFGSSKHTGDVVWAAKTNHLLIPPDSFDHNNRLSFCGNNFCVMSCWDEYLTALYGDYHIIPPENERGNHSLNAWYL